MFKLNNETKIGLLAVIAIAMGIWGYKFLKGINILTTSQTFYVKYAQVDQLTPSSPVFLSGFQVGTVKSLAQDPEDGKTIIATLNLERGILVPKETFATIVSQSALGGKAVSLDFEKPCSGPDCAQSGDYLRANYKNFLQSIIGNPEQIDEYTSRLQKGLTSVYDSIADPRDPQGFGRTLVSLQSSLANIAIMTAKVNNLLDASASGFTATANNTADITKAIKESNSSLVHALANLDSISQQIKGAGLDKSAAKAGSAIDSVTTSLASLRTTLSNASNALQKVDVLAGKLSTGEGSAGKLLTDEQLYNNLVVTSRHLHLLSQDLRLNPKRYTTVKLKLFGKNKTPNYMNPIDDPAYKILIDSLERDYNQKIKK
jgi:phospholipid/cholesterol/gamma-HCH transport system substrate-binding protein